MTTTNWRSEKQGPAAWEHLDAAWEHSDAAWEHSDAACRKQRGALTPLAFGLVLLVITYTVGFGFGFVRGALTPLAFGLVLLGGRLHRWVWFCWW